MKNGSVEVGYFEIIIILHLPMLSRILLSIHQRFTASKFLCGNSADKSLPMFPASQLGIISNSQQPKLYPI